MLLVLAASLSLRIESNRIHVIPIFDSRLPELCTFRRTLGIDCPGCGMTRSFVLTSRLQFLQAWKMNPAGSLLFVTIMASAPFRYAQWLRTRRGTAVRSTLAFETGWLVAIAGVMMLSWLSKIFL